MFARFDGEMGSGSDLLDLPGLRTIRFKKTQHDVVIEAKEVLSPPTCCPGCGGFLFVRHGAPTRFVKDLPTLARRSRIFFKWRRYMCQVCRHTWQQPLPGINTRRGMTERLISYIERESMEAQPFACVAAETGVSEQTVRDVFTGLGKRLEQERGVALRRGITPRHMGVDECYIDGVARFVITDLDRRRTFEILPKKDKLTLTHYFIQMPHRERVEAVVMDMWPPYREIVRRFLPGAKIVVDKFHVLRKANQAVMAVCRRVREKLPAARRSQCMPNTQPRKGKGKRSRFLLLKRSYRLSKAEAATLEEWKEQYSEIGAAYDFKEEIFDIYQIRERKESERRYDDWARRVRAHPLALEPAFRDLLRAVDNWRAEVFNYFEHRVTNGQTEARNNVIKSMQRQGRGYDFETVRTMALYCGEVAPPRPPNPLDASRQEAQAARMKSRRAKPDPCSPRSNARKLRQARRANDVFTELTRPPRGFVERFQHFVQLKLLPDLSG